MKYFITGFFMLLLLNLSYSQSSQNLSYHDGILYKLTPKSITSPDGSNLISSDKEQIGIKVVVNYNLENKYWDVWFFTKNGNAAGMKFTLWKKSDENNPYDIYVYDGEEYKIIDEFNSKREITILSRKIFLVVEDLK